MRFTILPILVATLGLAACGGSNPPAATPGVTETFAYGEQPQALPRYFSVEVSPSGLRAVGQDVTDEQLRDRAAREAADPTLQGAAVTVAAGVSENRAVDIVRLLVRAGFKHVVFSSREGLDVEVSQFTPAPDQAHVAVLPPSAPAPNPIEETPPPRSQPSSSQLNPPSPEPAAPPVPNNVEVKQLGLHVGGGPNDAATHALYATPIERRFDDLKRCYPLAQGANKNASFGVDLLIPSKGGTAKIKDYRTVLGGKDFHLCVLGVFGGIEFPGPGKLTVVSYSVLFKPL